VDVERDLYELIRRGEVKDRKQLIDLKLILNSKLICKSASAIAIPRSKE
jgi:hypothetical protein